MRKRMGGGGCVCAKIIIVVPGMPRGIAGHGIPSGSCCHLHGLGALSALQLTGAGGGEQKSLVASFSSAAGPKVSTWERHLVVALKGTGCPQELLFSPNYARARTASWRILPVTTLMGSCLSPPASPGPFFFITGPPHAREESMPACPGGRSHGSLCLQLPSHSPQLPEDRVFCRVVGVLGQSIPALTSACEEQGK